MAMTITWSLIGSNGSTTDFKLQGNTSTEATYVAPSVGSAAEPVVMKVTNETKPLTSNGSDRHRITVQRVKRDTTTNVAHVCSATVVWTVPRAGVFTDDDLLDVWSWLANMMSTVSGNTWISRNADALIDNILP